MTQTRKKIGLALGSGGVRGLAHIGVIKELKKNNIPIDFIAGASAGALVGAFYAAHLDVNGLEKIAMDTNWQTAFSVFDPTWHGGLLKGKKIENLIKQWLLNIDFSGLKIPLAVVATDLKSGKEIDIKEGDLIKAVRASLAVPPVFQPIEANGYLLSDGGLSNPVPAAVVRKMGADIVIAVNLDNGKFNDGNNFSKHSSLTKTSIRALNIIRHYLAKNSLQYADVVIEPKVAEVGLVGWNRIFDNNQVTAIIKEGELVAAEKINEIKQVCQ
ncbi:MAG: patatin-like phospholipase family protein [Patescibacteria group bacterium]